MLASNDAAQKVISLITMLKEQGATTALAMAVAHIVVDERVRLKCRVPLCDSYHKNLMCPPFVMSVEEFRKALAGYSEAIILQVSGPIDGLRGGNQPAEDVFAPAGKLHELVNLGERAAFVSGFHLAAGLIGGCCRLCEVCVAVEGSWECRFPFRARPSLEAMGIDVIATLHNAGLTLSFPVQERVAWTGLILLQ